MIIEIHSSTRAILSSARISDVAVKLLTERLIYSLIDFEMNVLTVKDTPTLNNNLMITSEVKRPNKDTNNLPTKQSYHIDFTVILI